MSLIVTSKLHLFPFLWAVLGACVFFPFCFIDFQASFFHLGVCDVFLFFYSVRVVCRCPSYIICVFRSDGDAIFRCYAVGVVSYYWWQFFLLSLAIQGFGVGVFVSFIAGLVGPFARYSEQYRAEAVSLGDAHFLLEWL